MSVIVKDKNTNKTYILLGTGFGAYRAVSPSFFGGNLFPHEEEGTIATVAVCDSKGDIIWINSDDLQVIEIDGAKVSEIDLFESERMEEELNKSKITLNHDEACPACGTKANGNEKYCSGCGLKLTG
ncbi:MAG: hypothetical protein JJT76_10820 [Clostridiaceae bacterium]|nr:hypothetical protein [Clostridiaceae bacterium]